MKDGICSAAIIHVICLFLGTFLHRRLVVDYARVLLMNQGQAHLELWRIPKILELKRLRNLAQLINCEFR
jgi:hypothetical protein